MSESSQRPRSARSTPNRTMGRARIRTHQHRLFPNLFCVGVRFTPYVPLGGSDPDAAAPPVILGDTTEGGQDQQAYLVSDFSDTSTLAGKVPVAGPGIYRPDIDKGEPSRYLSWKAELNYAEDRGWEAEGSLKVATTDVTLAATGPSQKEHTRKPISMPECNLQLSRRRYYGFNPNDIVKNYFRTINDTDWTLPDGQVVPAECANT